jgi:hypothetical protein
MVAFTSACVPSSYSFVGDIKGTIFGVFAVMPTAGWLIDVYGWESVFYATGTLTLLWCIPGALLVYDSPEKHPRISYRERMFINEAITTSKERATNPAGTSSKVNEDYETNMGKICSHLFTSYTRAL